LFNFFSKEFIMKKVFALIALFVALSYFSYAADAVVSVSVAHTFPTITLTTFDNTAIVLHPGNLAVAIPSALFTVTLGDPGTTCTVSDNGGWSGSLTGVTVTPGSLSATTGISETGGTTTYSGATLACANATAVQPGVDYTLSVTVTVW
jgi:hypothetical protein